MTKEEVLQGALSLNDGSNEYTVFVEGDNIIIEAFYGNADFGKSKFRFVARLKNDNTFTESSFFDDGTYKQYGGNQKFYSYSSDGMKCVFDSESIKSILRTYLESCGYKKSTNLKYVFLIAIPIITVIVFIVVITSLLSGFDYVDTNGEDNFALTDIKREDILGTGYGYKSYNFSNNYYGDHTGITSLKYQNYDYDYINMSFGKIHGVTFVNATKISGDTLELHIESTVESGNAEIVILVDGEYYRSVEVNKKESVILEDISNKEVFVKLGCEGAKMEIEVARIY